MDRRYVHSSHWELGGDNMTDTKEPRTIKELREVASMIDEMICEVDLTVEEVMIVVMMIKETAAANLAARAVMDKIQIDMKNIAKIVEEGCDVRVVELKPPNNKKFPVMPLHSSDN